MQNLVLLRERVASPTALEQKAVAESLAKTGVKYSHICLDSPARTAYLLTTDFQLLSYHLDKQEVCRNYFYFFLKNKPMKKKSNIFTPAIYETTIFVKYQPIAITNKPNRSEFHKTPLSFFSLSVLSSIVSALDQRLKCRRGRFHSR